MAKMRVYRSNLGPWCVVGIIAGIVVAIVGIVGLIGGSDPDRSVMTLVGGAILLVLSIIVRVSNSSYIDGGSPSAATGAAAPRSARVSVKLPDDPKFLAVYNNLPNCANMDKLAHDLSIADGMVAYGNDYTSFYRDNRSKEALLCVYQRYPRIALKLAAQEYDKVVKIYGTYDVASLTPDEQRYRYVLNLSMFDQKDFNLHLDELKARGVLEAVLSDPDTAKEEFMKYPSKKFLTYLRENAPEGYAKVIGRFFVS